jgi:hypothetical protein
MGDHTHGTPNIQNLNVGGEDRRCEEKSVPDPASLEPTNFCIPEPCSYVMNSPIITSRILTKLSGGKAPSDVRLSSTLSLT